jgi:tetrahydromethanopterin S-methyltransferase subunit D
MLKGASCDRAFGLPMCVGDVAKDRAETVATFGVSVFEAILAVAEGDSGGTAVGFHRIQLDRFPQAAINRRIGEIITVMEIDQMVRSHRTLLCGVVERAIFSKCLP